MHRERRFRGENLLIPGERYTPAQPTLVRLLGTYRALVIQQVHFHVISHGRPKREGESELWAKIPASRICQECGMKEDGVYHAMEGLLRVGLLERCRLRTGKSDRAYSWRVNLELLQALISEKFGLSDGETRTSSGSFPNVFGFPTRINQESTVTGIEITTEILGDGARARDESQNRDAPTWLPEYLRAAWKQRMDDGEAEKYVPPGEPVRQGATNTHRS